MTKIIKYLLLIPLMLILISYTPLNNINENNYFEQNAFYSKQLTCLAKNIYYEARGESFEGKLGVATVTLNRVNDKRFPDTICEVVYQKTGKVYQFSWVGQNVKALTDNYAWQESYMIAEQVISGKMIHIKLEKALYYHATSVHPNWKKRYIIAKVGNHIFYQSI